MSSILKVDQIQLSNGNTPTAGDLGLNTTGSVLQVVSQKNKANTGSTTTNAFTATNLTLSITPSSTSSKILVMANATINTQQNTSWADVTVYRDGSVNLALTGSGTSNANAFSGVYTSSGTDVHVPFAFQVLDTPSTTSAVTYTVYFRSRNNASFVRFNPDKFSTGLTLMEIAG